MCASETGYFLTRCNMWPQHSPPVLKGVVSLGYAKEGRIKQKKEQLIKQNQNTVPH